MTTLEDIVQELQARRGKWRELCDDTGLSYWWVLKLARGAIAEPGLTKIQKLQAYFAARPRSADPAFGAE